MIKREYKWIISTNYLFYLYSLSRTIECETIKNHMHCASSHEIQIPTKQIYKNNSFYSYYKEDISKRAS